MRVIVIIYLGLLILGIIPAITQAETTKERISTYGEVSLESRYFRVATGIWVISVRVGRERDIRAEEEYVRKWKHKVSPIMEGIKAAIEGEIETVRSSLKLPLLKYEISLWTISEEEIGPSGTPDYVAKNNRPFGYIIWFDGIQGLENGCALEVVFSKLPRKGVRNRLIKTLESILKGKAVKNGMLKSVVTLDDNRQKGIFGDYEPKNTPDTVFDYLPNLDRYKEYEAILKDLPPLKNIAESFAFIIEELKNLKALLVLLDEYAEKAEDNPGRYVEGNLLLGAKPNQYQPSGEELVLAEIGNRIKGITKRTPREILKEYIEKERIQRDKIEYHSFTFTHVDVMGSGRFYYASDPMKERIFFPLNDTHKDEKDGRSEEIKMLLESAEALLMQHIDEEVQMLEQDPFVSLVNHEKYMKAKELFEKVLVLDPENKRAIEGHQICEEMLQPYRPVQYLVSPPIADELREPVKGMKPWEILRQKRMRDARGLAYTAEAKFKEEEENKKVALQIVEAAKKKVEKGTDSWAAYQEALKQIKALQEGLHKKWKGQGPEILTFGMKALNDAFQGVLTEEKGE